MKHSDLKKFQKLLKDKSLSNTLKSIDLLSPVKLHNNYLKKNTNFFYLIKKILKLFFSNSLELLSMLFFFKNNKIYNYKQNNILIFSHLTNFKQIKKGKDAYFGEINLKKKHTRILINHTGINLSPNLFYKKLNKIFLPKKLCSKNEIIIFFKQLRCVGELLNLFCKKRINFNNLKQLIISLFDSQTKFALRFEFFVKSYVANIKPKKIYFTFEGFAWERQLIYWCKKIDHKISCIGYQHNILSHNNYSIFQSLNENYQPDKILCSNYPSYKILKKKTLKGKDKISLIGNLNLQSNLIIKSKENKKFILVAPEGIETENIKLFKFSLKCAKQNPQIKFLWRVHPVINFKTILNLLKIKENKLPKNIVVSKSDINRDFKKSKFILYRGSASVLNAVMNKIFPIYYKDDESDDFDPLFEYFKKSNYVTNEEEFFKLVSKQEKTKKIINKSFSKQIRMIKKDFLLRPNISEFI